MKIIFVLPIILTIALSFACKQPAPPYKDVARDDQNVTSHQNTLITIQPGQQYTIDLPISEDPTKFHWYYEVDTNWIISIIEQIDLTVPEKINANPQKPISRLPPMTRFNIKGLKAGKVRLRFFLKRPEETKGKYEHEILYDVNVTG